MAYPVAVKPQDRIGTLPTTSQAEPPSPVQPGPRGDEPPFPRDDQPERPAGTRWSDLASRWPLRRDQVVRWLQRSLLPWAALVLLVLTFRECHRLEPPPELTDDELRQAALWVRRCLDFPPPSVVAGAGDVAGILPRITVREPVFVTLYSRQARGAPALGVWEPSAAEPTASLADALRAAAKEARERLQGKEVSGELTVKIDVAGPGRRVWWRWPPYLEYVTNPGRDGWHAWGQSGQAYYLPSWRVEREQNPEVMLRGFREELASSFRLARFRTTAAVLLGGRQQPARLYRGNALLSELTTASVRGALREAGHYLARSINPRGAYCYEYLPSQDRCTEEYNLLRHAGTTYALYQLYRELPEPVFREAAERAAEWLRQRTRTVAGDPSRVFLLDGDLAKLGGAGLTLVALVERERALRDGKDRELMRQLASFLISQQREDGYFHSYFRWNPEKSVPTRSSIYYPGEALLGLVRLYSLDAEPRYLEAVNRGAAYLVLRRWRWGGVEVFVPPDAWLTQAVAELDAIAPVDWLRDYAYEIVRVTDHGMLRAEEGAEPDFAGGPALGFAPPQVTPAGSRNEGITAAWRMARRRGEAERVGWLRGLGFASARFQLSQQFRPENSFFFPHPERARGGFRESPVRNGVRIDYVQHNVTGLLGVLEMLRAEEL